MSGQDAEAVHAQMVDFKAVWDWPNGVFVGEPMNESHNPIDAHSSVTVRVSVPVPDATAELVVV